MARRLESATRALAVDGLINVRDLGCLPRRDGQVTPRGVFFRSESVDGVTSVGWDQIHAAGIRTVVDLRQAGERAQDVRTRPAWLTTRDVDLDGLENRDFWKDYWGNGFEGTALYYLPYLSAMPKRAGAALTAIVEAPTGGVLFHCSAGRDRTGLSLRCCCSRLFTPNGMGLPQTTWRPCAWGKLAPKPHISRMWSPGWTNFVARRGRQPKVRSERHSKDSTSPVG